MKAKTAVVTGAGSGCGRAIALALVRQGWQAALVGRRESALKETCSMAGDQSSLLSIFPCDIASPKAVEQLGRDVLEQFGTIEVLVNAAGTNTPRRSLEVLALEDYHHLIDTNLNGAYYCLQAFLPSMRTRRSGTIINIISDAGKTANAKAGVAYVISKFGMAGMTQSINTEERSNGIRACAIFPGDINTPILDKRPNPPPAEARERMLQAEDVAACALLAINLPERALVEEIILRPR